MIKFLRRYAMFLAAVLIGSAGVISSYTHVKPPTPQPKQICFHSSGENVKPEFRADGTMIRVNWIVGVINYDGDEVVGLAKYMYDEDLNMSVCDIWIPMPEQVIGDADMDTIGHEVLHCLAGAYHE